MPLFSLPWLALEAPRPQSDDSSPSNVTQILFLNKIDLFAEKLPRSPLGDYFPDYAGGDDYDAACNYLLHRFVSLNQSAATKQIYAHYTCATDTQQIKCE